MTIIRVISFLFPIQYFHTYTASGPLTCTPWRPCCPGADWMTEFVPLRKITLPAPLDTCTAWTPGLWITLAWFCWITLCTCKKWSPVKKKKKKKKWKKWCQQKKFNCDKKHLHERDYTVCFAKGTCKINKVLVMSDNLKQQHSMESTLVTFQKCYLMNWNILIL